MSIIAKIQNKSRRVFDDQIISKLTLNLPLEDTFIICGDPRGGTTWLAEMLLEEPNSVLMWEPLSIPMIKELNDLNFTYRQYIPESAKWPEAKNYLENIFKGNILNHHLIQNQSYKNLIQPKRSLVKFCRANQLLPWLTNNFDFNYAPIYLVRHPCAVIASQIKQGGWNHVDAVFDIPNCRYQSFYNEHADFLNSINSKVKRLAAMWALCNAVPLNHVENNKRWITVTYESLVQNGENELKRIEKRWNVQFSENVYKKLTKISSTTVSGSPVLEKKGSQLEYWKQQLSDSQIDEIIDVLNYFNIDLYNHSFYPTREYIN